MKDKLSLIIIALIFAGFFFYLQWWYSRPYVAQWNALWLCIALAAAFYYPSRALASRLLDERATAAGRLLVPLILAGLFAWTTSWGIRGLTVAHLVDSVQEQAAIVGLETCIGAKCFCENRWILQMADGKRHKLCTARSYGTVEYGKAVNVTVRKSPFDHSIE